MDSDEVDNVTSEIESRKPRIAVRPYAPTQAELDEHLPLHVNYRSWCEHCVAGKGISHQHTRRADGEAPLGVTISVDYCFMVSEEVEEDMIPVLIAYDDSKKCMWALAVDSKGANEIAVKWMCDKLDSTGYRGVKITVKSYQEPSILAFKRAVAARRVAETALIESPIRESKSNGQVERAVQTWQGQFRTLRHYIESRLNAKIPRDSAILQWLVVWSSDVLTKYKVHANGRTSYEMITGHRCKHQIVSFGERVHFKYAMDKNKRNKSESYWEIGYFLGIKESTTEYLVSIDGSICSSATIRRMTDQEAYSEQCIESVKINYWNFISDGARSTKNTVVIFA